jgi:hypothetical protein
MLSELLKALSFFIFAPIAIGAIVFSPLIVDDLSKFIDNQKEKKPVITYKAVKFGEQNAKGENQ